MSVRLTLALSSGDLNLPDSGEVAVICPTPAFDLGELPQGRVRIVQPFKPHFDHFCGLGFDCVPVLDAPCAVAILAVPRAKAQARDLLARAAARAELVVVDGAKTDGIDSLLKEARKRVAVFGPISKAHGKLFWFAPEPGLFDDWLAPDEQKANGYVTAPGVFSADGIDPASRQLLAALPAKLGSHLADFGAGWGYLSAEILATRPGIESIDLVEADHIALGCAQRNVTDPRARFHWADALTWAAPERLDCVVMNPPFHTGRAAEPALGRGFIAAAARALKPGGSLWMVANRHLPYESAVGDHFAKFTEVSGDNRFKILHAERPSRVRR